MNIAYHPDLLTFIKHKHLLLDTNVFIDASTKPSVFINLFNDLKAGGATLATIDPVKWESLKGSVNEEKYKLRDKLIKSIIDTMIPLTPNMYSLVPDLIKKYGLEGSGLQVTDLLLGAALMVYGNNLCLMTRDTTDFIQRIFTLRHTVNIPHAKGIFTYGIYQYLE